jgi:hypothetical protein
MEIIKAMCLGMIPYLAIAGNAQPQVVTHMV